MSELDKKLEEILETGATIYDGGGKMVFTYDDIVKHVKRAFIDDGWRRVTNTELKNIAKAHLIDEACMTGEEWYEKFESEHVSYVRFVGKEYNDGYNEARIIAIEAAKRASGMNNPSEGEKG